VQDVFASYSIDPLPSLSGHTAHQKSMSRQDNVESIDLLQLGDSRVWEYKMNRAILDLYNSECIQYIHTNMYDESPEATMKKLKGDIDRQTGRLMDPSKWGISNDQDRSEAHLLTGIGI
jgi:hypothetical protein